jgi:hypothetical protein
MRLHAAQKSLRLWPVMLFGSLILASLLAPAVGATRASAGRAAQPSVAIKGAPFKGAVAKGVVNLSTLPKATNAGTSLQPSLPMPQRGMSPQQQAEYDKNAIHLPGMPSATAHPMPDRSAATSPSFVGGGVLPPVYKSFEGLNSTQGTGNNTGGNTMATDLSYVMQASANAIGIFSSASGALLYGPYTSSSFFAPVKGNGDFLLEPQTFYDVMRDRWIVVYDELHIPSSYPDHGYIDIAVSQSNSPTQPAPGGQYWLYHLEATQFGTQYGENCRTPQIGADYWGLYIVCQAYPNGPGSLVGNYILALDKTRLYSGASATGAVYKNIAIDLNTCGSGGNSPCPARMLNPAVEDGVPDAEFFTAINDYSPVSSNLTLCAMTNTNALTGNITAPTLTCGNNTLPTSYAFPVSAQLPGGVTWNVGNDPSRMEYKAGMLHLSWTTAATVSGSAVDGIYWLDIQPQLTTVAAHNPQWVNGMVIQNQGIWALSSQTYLLAPMLWTTDEQDDVLIYQVVSSAHSIYPSIGYSGRKATDAPDTLGQDTSAFVVTGTRASSNRPPMCALPLNSVTRGIVWCSAGYGASQPNPGWDTRIFALRAE